MEWAAELPPGCLVAMEANCGAHHLANELRAIGLDARTTRTVIFCGSPPSLPFRHYI